MKRKFASALLGLLAGGIYTSASASDEFIRASVEVTKLKFEIIDLTPEDGADPSVTFGTFGGLSAPNTYAYIGAYTSESGNYLYQNRSNIDGNIFSPGEYTVSVQGNSQTVGAAGFKQDVVVDLNNVKSFLGGITTDYASNNYMATENELNNFGLNISLGANTGIRITGQIQQTATINMDALLLTAEWQRLQNAGYGLLVDSQFYAKLQAANLYESPGFEIFEMPYSSYNSDGISNVGLSNPGISEINLTYTNRDALPVDHWISFQSKLDTSVQTYLLPIPEPSTYSLMVLGLVGIGAVARRSRQNGHA